MKIQDLGQVDRPILLFGGVYSNLHALNALWDWADQSGILPLDRICTGDIAAYCADPEACIRFLMEQRTPVVAGNCEIQLALGSKDCGCGFDEDSMCNILSGAWYAHAARQVTPQMQTYLSELPERIVFRHFDRRYVAIHGGANDVAQFIWSVTDQDALDHEVATLEAQVGPIDAVIAGHSGIPFERSLKTKTWINAGAIGMPAHDASAQTHFAVLDRGTLLFHRLSYDVSAAKAAMVAAGLIQGYHEALISGIWPSEETLPLELRHSAASG
ncbi:MAG: metallophosphoesterase family protein [Pseudomonadota bacterium]